MYAGLWRDNLSKRNCLENLSMDDRIKLKSIYNRIGERELDSSGLE